MINLNISFRTKVTLYVIVILLIFGIGLSLIISHIATQALVTENKKRGISSAVNLKAQIVEPLLAMDFLRLKNLINAVGQTDRDISYTFVLDKASQPLIYTFSGGFPEDLREVNTVADQDPYHIRLLATDKELIYDIAVPILIGPDRLGTVRLGMSRRHVQSIVHRLLVAIFLTTGLGVLVAGFVGTALARSVTRKIQALHWAAEEVIKGNLNVRSAIPPKRQCWEIKQCERQECPAFGDRERRCWHLAGTLCPTCVEGKYEDKIVACHECPVYKALAGDELQHLTEFFDIMVLTLRERMEALTKSEENLKQQQQLFQTILDVTPDIVCLQGRDFRYQAVNKAFCAFLGKAESEILGKTDMDLFPPEQARLNQQENHQVIADGETLRLEKRTRGAANHRWLHVVKTPVRGPEGEIIGLLCNGRDITEMKLLHDRIMRAQKLESLGQLAAGVAHEINTPLGIILGNTQLTLEEVQPHTEIYENLRVIEKYARICKTIVADLLRFSRHTESIKKSLNINEILNQVLAVVEHTFGLERITLERHLAPDLPPVFGDQEKIEQVFMNLLNNAYDAIGEEGKVTITTSYDEPHQEVVIAIADTGIGITREIKDKIFDPFFTTKGVGKGTGLGLSVIFGIIRDHGGKIDFQSPYPSPDISPALAGIIPNPGTLFTIRLPAYERVQDKDIVLHG